MGPELVQDGSRKRPSFSKMEKWALLCPLLCGPFFAQGVDCTEGEKVDVFEVVEGLKAT